MNRREQKKYRFEGIEFTDGPDGPSGHGDAFWLMYHRFNILSHKEQVKLIVKEENERSTRK